MAISVTSGTIFTYWPRVVASEACRSSPFAAFALAIAEKRITIVTPLTPEQLQAQLAATEKKRLEAELIRDRKQRNQSNRINHSNSTGGPNERVVEFRATMKQ